MGNGIVKFAATGLVLNTAYAAAQGVTWMILDSQTKPDLSKAPMDTNKYLDLG